MQLRTLVPPLLVASSLVGAAAAQTRAVSLEGRIVVLEGGDAPVSIQATAQPGTEGGASEASSPRAQKLKALEFDRRPSAILAAWAKPPEPEETEDEEAAGEEEAQPQPEPAPETGPEPAAEATEPADAGPGEATEGAEAEAEADADAAAKAAEAEEAEREAEQEAARKAAEEKALGRELATFQRQVTLGEWTAVRDYLAGLSEAEAEVGYGQLLKSLQQGPKQKPSVPQPGRPYLEVNRFAPRDVLGLAEAAPHELEKEQLALLGQILAQAHSAGHQLEAFLAELEPHLAEEGLALDRRRLALVLVNADQPLLMEGLLPTLEQAVEENDREGLNLLSRFLLAKYDKEKKVEWLERAWHVTQAVLAVGEVSDAEKDEALKRAVDIAPRIHEELGQAWLDESFAARPERGMEILAAIGAAASMGLAAQPLEEQARFKLLELQTTAADALLAAAPERADAWRRELTLLASNWLREAEYTYQWDESTRSGPRMQRDVFGNFFYYSSSAARRGNMPTPITTDEMLEIRPGDAWLERVDDTLRPRLHMVFAQLLLKVAEEAEAFPYIELVAERFPRQAKELCDEFLRVWARNHNPNEARGNQSQYVFFYGFEQRASGIPLTRSKQERNLAELGEWVARLRELPVELDDALMTRAFTTAHSSAEVYRLETIEQIFGPLGELQPETLAELLQGMRANLVGVWRDPALQKDAGTNRRQKDIEAEVLRGYELAHDTLSRALSGHPDSWQLWLAQAAIDHDENNYRHELGDDPEFSGRRLAAFETFRRAAELYVEQVPTLEQDDESTRAFELWFYAALGACDLNAIDPEMPLAARQVPLIAELLRGLPGERAERHTAKFASTLFTRMSNVSPAVKFRYVREGLAIVGEHEMADEAREVFDYYSDLVTEIQLVARVDGGDRVGHARPFGLRVDIRHTKEIERESGGFAKYLQNQNAQRYAFNYGRPTEDYRDKFEEAAREALSEHFEVLSVTFNAPEARSRAEPEYGWRVTPYAYLLLKPRGPQVDRVPPLRLDLDFLDTSGYAVLPVESPPAPIDARDEAGDPRPYERLALTQTLDERQAADGKLILEVKATAVGLVPELDELLDLAPQGFEQTALDDHGVSVVQFDEQADAIDSERTWTVTLRARDDLAALPTRFAFGRPKAEVASSEHFRYVDADLATVGPTIELEQRYGEADRTWLWWIPALLLLGAGAWLGWRRLRRPGVELRARFQVPEPLTPFTVLGLLRSIETGNGLAQAELQDLAREIEALERHFFVEDRPGDPPDLRRIAEAWVGRAR